MAGLVNGIPGSMTSQQALHLTEVIHAELRYPVMMARLHAERLQRESDPKFIDRQGNCEL